MPDLWLHAYVLLYNMGINIQIKVLTTSRIKIPNKNKLYFKTSKSK
jgi:hypothetical protein